MAAGLPNWGEAMKRMLGTFVSAVVVLVVVALPARPAGAEPVADEARFLVLLNQLRAERGLRPLVSDSQMVGVARQWSARMASESTLYHNGDLPNQVTNWRMLGENVGVGSDVQQLHDAFVASPHHYENMVEPAFDATGIGVVEGGGQIWVTVTFKQSKTIAASSPAPAPATPAPAPRVAAAPKAAAPKPAAKPAPRPTAPRAAAPKPAPATTAPVPTTAAPAPVPEPEPEVAGAAFERSSTENEGASPVTDAGLAVLAVVLLLAVTRGLLRLRTA